MKKPRQKKKKKDRARCVGDPPQKFSPLNFYFKIPFNVEVFFF